MVQRGHVVVRMGDVAPRMGDVVGHWTSWSDVHVIHVMS